MSRASGSRADDSASSLGAADKARLDHVAPEALRFAREHLGPASERLLSDPAVQVPVLSRVRNGSALEDALLCEVHRAAARDRDVADEFVAYFLSDLMRVGHKLRSSSLRRFLDTGDLVQSILGDLWSDLCQVRFESRGRFLSYLARKLSWKATDRVRALGAGTRREDLRVELDVAELVRPEADEASLAGALHQDERDRLALVLLRLSERDRRLLTLCLQGRCAREIGAELGLSAPAARMAVSRAIRKARRLL